MQPASLRELISNSTIFITGATGFVGGVLLERILRAELPPNKVYLLVRKRRGTDPNERVNEIFSSPVSFRQPSFESLKYLPKVMAMVTCPVLFLPGDGCSKNLPLYYYTLTDSPRGLYRLPTGLLSRI
jgi:hypothetical protein